MVTCEGSDEWLPTLRHRTDLPPDRAAASAAGRAYAERNRLDEQIVSAWGAMFEPIRVAR